MERPQMTQTQARCAFSRSYRTVALHMQHWQYENWTSGEPQANRGMPAVAVAVNSAQMPCKGFLRTNLRFPHYQSCAVRWCALSNCRQAAHASADSWPVL
jgi:hypothetical protein